MADEDDYVPGQADPNYDYTAGDKAADNPISDEIGDDAEIATNFRSDISADEVEKGSWRQPKPGEHVFYIKSIEWADGGVPAHEKVYLRLPSGEVRAAHFDSRKIQITFAIPGDENQTMRDFFMLPPAMESQMQAYEFGFGKESDASKKESKEGGVHAKRLKHFLARLGYQCDEKGRLPASASKIAQWRVYPGTKIARFIKMEVLPPDGNKYRDKKTGEEKTSTFARLKMFSYAFVNPPPEVAIAQRTAAEAAKNASSSPVVTQPQLDAHSEVDSTPEPAHDKPKSAGKKAKASASS